MIRPARVADAAAIAAVHERAREAWAAFADVSRLEGGVSVWAQRLATGDAEAFVAGDDGVVAFVALRDAAGDDDLAGAPVGEVAAVYVDPDAQRRGHGAALLDFAGGWARERGLEELVLWCWVDNAAAQAFYTARGWRREPGTVLRDERLGLDEVRFRLAL